MSETNNLGFHVTWQCVTKSVQPQFLFLVDLIDKIEQMLVLCIIQVPIANLLKEALTYLQLVLLVQWSFKSKMPCTQSDGIIKRKICTNTILQAAIGK